MSKHTTGAWLGMLGKLVSATGNRDASAWEQGEQVATAHTELFNELRRMDEVQAELLEALEALAVSAPSACCGDFNHKKGDFHEGDEKCPPLDRYEKACLLARAAIAKARGES